MIEKLKKKKLYIIELFTKKTNMSIYETYHLFMKLYCFIITIISIKYNKTLLLTRE